MKKREIKDKIYEEIRKGIEDHSTGFSFKFYHLDIDFSQPLADLHWNVVKEDLIESFHPLSINYIEHSAGIRICLEKLSFMSYDYFEKVLEKKIEDRDVLEFKKSNTINITPKSVDEILKDKDKFIAFIKENKLGRLDGMLLDEYADFITDDDRVLKINIKTEQEYDITKDINPENIQLLRGFMKSSLIYNRNNEDYEAIDLVKSNRKAEEVKAVLPTPKRKNKLRK